MGKGSLLGVPENPAESSRSNMTFSRWPLGPAKAEEQSSGCSRARAARKLVI